MRSHKRRVTGEAGCHRHTEAIVSLTTAPVASHAPHRARGVAWAVGCATAYSLSSVVGKDLLEPLGVGSLLLFRFALGAAVCWLVVMVWARFGGPHPLRCPKARLFGMGVWFGALVVTGFLSLERLPASTYIVLVYTYPVIVAVVSSLLGKPLSPLLWAALAVTFSGVVLTVPDVFTDPGRVDAAGVALALAQAVLFAVYLVANERIVPERVNGLVAAAWSLPGAALCSVPVVAFDGLRTPPDAEVGRMLALFVLVPTVLAITTFFLALRDLDPTVLAMILTLEIALAIIWSVIFLGEDIGPAQVIGALMVAAGVLWSERVDRLRADAAPIQLP